MRDDRRDDWPRATPSDAAEVDLVCSLNKDRGLDAEVARRNARAPAHRRQRRARRGARLPRQRGEPRARHARRRSPARATRTCSIAQVYLRHRPARPTSTSFARSPTRTSRACATRRRRCARSTRSPAPAVRSASTLEALARLFPMAGIGGRADGDRGRPDPRRLLAADRSDADLVQRCAAPHDARRAAARTSSTC